MTCSVTTIENVPNVTAEDLQKAGYQFPVPFLFELEQGEIYAEEVVRIVPGKRMLVFGTWRGMPVAAKLFFDKKHAKRHADEDAKGIKLMQDYKIPTPILHYQGSGYEQPVEVLIFERIAHSKDLYKLWQQRESDQAVLPILHAVMIELATQHVLGLVQEDMHLGNYLISGKLIYTLDGSDIKATGSLLSKKESMQNLALLLSQLGAGIQTLQESLFLHYARARGWLLKAMDTFDLKLLIKQCDAMRWQDFQKKIFRNSTQFQTYKRLGWRGMLARRANGKDMQAFLQNPDSVFNQENVVYLKKGRSSTVIKTVLDGKTVVIKRYNLKDIWHRLRRMWRSTRAELSWRLAQKLSLFQVNTPTPLAYVESYWFGFHGKSYFVMEHIEGQDVKQFLAPFEKEPYRAASAMQRICKLLHSLQQLELTHGDLKSSNIIITADEQPYLIDLDGAKEHFTLAGLRTAWREERQRFLQNFDDLPALHQVLLRLMQPQLPG